jgi:hypothetical protein
MSIPNREQSSLGPVVHTHLVILSFFIVLIGILGAESALAQNHDSDRIQEYIDRNAELLEWAHEVVRESENVPARKVLNEASNLHQRSMGLMQQNHGMRAFNLAKNCRTATRKAVRMARESTGFEERVRLRSERFRDQYTHLLEQARESNNQQALDFLRRSEHRATRAYEQFHQGDAKLAFKMLEQAEEMMHRAGRLMGPAGAPERLDRTLEIAQMTIERVREKLQEHADPAAWKLLTESEQALDRALGFRDQGQPGRAQKMADLAHGLANRAGGFGGTGPSDETVRRQIERWDSRNERVEEMVSESGVESAHGFLVKAREHRNRAGQSLDQEDFEQALRQIRTAHDLLTQAEDSLR